MALYVQMPEGRKLREVRTGRQSVGRLLLFLLLLAYCVSFWYVVIRGLAWLWRVL